MNHIISSKNTLVYDIYIKSRETNPWVKKVKNLLNGQGHSYIIININSIKLNLNTIKQRIQINFCKLKMQTYVILKNSTFSRVSTIWVKDHLMWMF